MPLFSRKSGKRLLDNENDNNNNNSNVMANGKENGSKTHNHNNNSNNNYHNNVYGIQQYRQQQEQPSSSSFSQQLCINKPQLIFHCQLAHGSPTGLITGFSNVRELYKKIAECYEISSEEILFCTLNSHKIDMTKLLGGQIALDDFIFAHQKGQPKEIEMIKTEEALGLTITDNGAGLSFIKRIKDNSIISRIPQIHIGDHIEKLNGVSMVGKRHYDVAKALREIKSGDTFTIRLVEPLNCGFQNIGPRSQLRPLTSGLKNHSTGHETLRFKANGNAEIEEKFDEITQSGIEAINNLLESFMGISDTELAIQIWDISKNKNNSMDFAEDIDNSDLESFGFTDDFIIELWGAITDARRKRCKNTD